MPPLLGNITGIVALFEKRWGENGSKRGGIFASRRAAGALIGGRLTFCGQAPRADWVTGTRNKRGKLIRPGDMIYGAVEIKLQQRADGTTGAFYSGLAHCGDVWCCPVCAQKIKRKRGEQIAQVLKILRAEKKKIFFLTLTVPHYAHTRARGLRRQVSECYRAMKQDKAFRGFLKKNGYVGDIRAMEVTHGGNGWHPHLHCLYIFDSDIDEKKTQVKLTKIWQRVVTRMGGKLPSDERGVNFKRVNFSDAIAHYAAGMEMSSAGGKQGRAGSRTPMEILNDFRCEGKKQDAILFRAYAIAMYGANHLTWSKELRVYRKRVDGEKTDEQIANEKTEGARVCEVNPAMLRYLIVNKIDCRLLDEIERGSIDGALAWLRNRGAPVEWYPDIGYLCLSERN